MKLKVSIDSLSIADNNILDNSEFELVTGDVVAVVGPNGACLLYTSPSPRDRH